MLKAVHFSDSKGLKMVKGCKHSVVLSQLFVSKSQKCFIIMCLPEESFPLLSDWIHCAETSAWTCPGRESLSYRPELQSSHKQFWSKTVRKYTTFTKQFLIITTVMQLQLCKNIPWRTARQQKEECYVSRKMIVENSNIWRGRKRLIVICNIDW